MYEDVISQFEDFLNARQLVKNGQAGTYGNWVHRFLCFAQGLRGMDFDACLLRFSALLCEREQRPDRQVAQARDAVRIYYHQFRKIHPKGSGGIGSIAAAEEIRKYTRERSGWSKQAL